MEGQLEGHTVSFGGMLVQHTTMPFKGLEGSKAAGTPPDISTSIMEVASRIRGSIRRYRTTTLEA